jgi:signal transduction histidine kinase/CheY-like chemotaxis protein
MATEQPTVLVVDDHSPNRGILSRALRDLDVHILEAGSGAEALEIIQQDYPFCVALLDVRMPHMDGYTVAARIREHPQTATLPIIFISAVETDAYHHQKAYDTGAVDFLHKPVSPRILQSKVRVFLELYRQRRELEMINRTLAHQTMRLQTTADVSQRIASILDLDELLFEILTLLRSRFGYHYLGIWMADETSPEPQIRLQAGQYGTPKPLSEPGFTIPVDIHQSIIARAWLTGETYLSNDTTCDAYYLPTEGLNSIRSELAIPLRFGGKLIGILDFQSEKENAFPPGDVQALTTLADQIAVAVRNVRLYAEVNRLNEALEADVAARTEELERAYHQLALLDQSKADFITVLSHELRTPLTLISGFSQMLAEDPTISGNASRRQQVEGVITGARRMHALVDSMLDVVKIDSRTLRLDRHKVAVCDVITALCEQIAPAIEERQQELVLKHLAELPHIEADKAALNKIFDELLSNAIKYTPDGGRITISGQLLEIDQEDAPDYVEVVVSDTGIGISPHQKELIFAKFYRTGDVTLHSSGRTKFKAGGPGLGLAVARGLVEALGGHIWVDSPGYDEIRLPGSQFHVMLPLTQPTL